MIKLIVAADENWAIGYQNELLYHIKEDMKRFKALTTGNIVVMGRKTLESMPNGAPLPNRENVVLSSRNLKAEVTLCHTLAELGEYLRTQKKDIYIIGGETIYQELLDYCADENLRKKRGGGRVLPRSGRAWKLAYRRKIGSFLRRRY